MPPDIVTFRSDMHDELSPPSSWIMRFAPLIAAGARVLDVACGAGRHARLFAARGCKVEAVDRDPEALATMNGITDIHTRIADLEHGDWPYAAGEFDAIIVTNYLYRPLFQKLLANLNDTGVLIYETFMQGNEKFGKPSNPDFLLRPGELMELAGSAIEIVAFEQGYVELPKPAMLQRLAAVKPGFQRSRSI
jgi:SAM-dependent methyltransferase